MQLVKTKNFGILLLVLASQLLKVLEGLVLGRPKVVLLVTKYFLVRQGHSSKVTTKTQANIFTIARQVWKGYNTQQTTMLIIRTRYYTKTKKTNLCKKRIVIFSDFGTFFGHNKRRNSKYTRKHDFLYKQQDVLLQKEDSETSQIWIEGHVTNQDYVIDQDHRLVVENTMISDQ